jgi:hypothetical protein
LVDVGQEHSFEVAAVDDQEPVEALAADVADPAFGEGVRSWPRTGVRTIRIASERNISSKAAVNVLSRSWIRKRIGSDRFVNVSMVLRACWVAHFPVGLANGRPDCLWAVALDRGGLAE